MKISELYKSVAQLGFEETLESDTRFFFAANRALLQVAALRPAEASVVIHHAPLENRVGVDSFTPLWKKSELTFEASGVKSYYFECDGTGDCYIERYDASAGTWKVIGWVSMTASRVFTAYRGIIKEDGVFTAARVRLRFAGEYLYAVKNVAMYSHLFSESETDIPAYEPFVRYDISAMVPDFLSLKLPLIQKSGEYVRMSDGYEVENDRVLLLPRDGEGLYKVVYHHRPAALIDNGDTSSDSTEIDLDEELCALLPFLVAALVWVDDEPQKAEYYLSIYRERAALLVSQRKNNAPVNYHTNGW